ncbi:TPA: hypothetical protein ROX98_000271 [Bacillus pseudomycoides]|nr:hypothetical protein [Bacillus pseudomycoides]
MYHHTKTKGDLGVLKAQVDLCYYFDPKVFRKSISLRVKAPKNYQEKNINFADEYREMP